MSALPGAHEPWGLFLGYVLEELKGWACHVAASAAAAVVGGFAREACQEVRVSSGEARGC